MRFQSLSLRDFRNLAAVDLEPDPRFNVFVGPNGQGKTNLLEAIYFVAALKSFRALKNAALVRHEAERAQLSAWVDRSGVRREVAINLGPRSRRVTLNGSSVRRLADFFGLVNIVAFVPEDVAVLKGSPGDRRTFLDRMVFNAAPAYASEMSDYEAALKQRNALIKDGHIPDRALLDIYDQQLTAHAVNVITRRAAYLDDLRGPFCETFGEIFGPGYDPDIRYRTHFLADDPEHDALLGDVVDGDGNRLAEAIRRALRDRLPRDLARGHTSVGPHRDDFLTTLAGQPAREFASQGQHRALVLSLKITEIRRSIDRDGHCPILLLDDVSSELDPGRNARLFEFLGGIDGQVFISTTDTNYLRLEQPYAKWSVSEGTVHV